jgi:L-fuconolactonase
MRIDSHQHFWRYSPASHAWIDDSMAVLKRDYMPEHLRIELDASAFDGSVAVQAAQSLDETRFLLELAERDPWIRGVVGWVDLLATNVRDALAEFSSAPRLVGVRHIVQSEPDEFMARPDFRRGIAALAEFDLAYDVLVHARQLPAAIDLVRAFEGQRFVLDHVGKPDIRRGAIDEWARQIAELGRCPNVWCKVSGMVTEADWMAWTDADLRPYLDVVFEAFGPRRLMIGSDWPVCTLAASHARVMDVVAAHVRALSVPEREALFGETAMQFYKL